MTTKQLCVRLSIGVLLFIQCYWSKGEYAIRAEGSGGVVVSSNALLDVVRLDEALNATNLTWTSSGVGWGPETTNSHDGVAAAVCNPVDYRHPQGDLETTVVGPGTLSFWWQISTVAWFGFKIDGVVNATAISYGWGWQKKTFYIPPGNHTLTWSCFNDQTFTKSDAYLDSVTYVPGISAPKITSQPQDQALPAGVAANFSTTSSVQMPSSWQWYFNGVKLPDGTNSVLTLYNVQEANSGTYYLVVSNWGGIAISSNAVLTIKPSPPVVYTPPSSQVVTESERVTFSVSCAGTSPESYQWYFGEQALIGATNYSLTITNVQVAHAGKYHVRISNAMGVVDSSDALLTVNKLSDLRPVLDSTAIELIASTDLPWVLQTNITHDGVSAAQSGPIGSGKKATLKGIVTGPATVSFWWKMSGSTNYDFLRFFVNGVQQAAISGTVDWQQVSCVIGSGPQTLEWTYVPYFSTSSYAGWVDQLQVNVGGKLPSIISSITNIAAHAGNRVVLTNTATGTPLLCYQWFLDGSEIPSATNSALSLDNIQAEDAGTYAVRVKNDFGFAIATNAVVTVAESTPVIVSAPAGISMARNSCLTFSVLAKGTGPLSFQWFLNGYAISGATNAVLALQSLTERDAGNYTVVVSNSLGSATSVPAYLEVLPSVVREFWYKSSGRQPTPLGLSNIVAVAAGQDHSLALNDRGTVLAWGDNTYGQTNVPAGLVDVVAISAGYNHSLALRRDGVITVWGDNRFAQRMVPPNATNVIAIATCADHNLALRDDGIIIGWGGSNYVANVPANLSNVVAIAAGNSVDYALKKDGLASGWPVTYGSPPVIRSTATNLVAITGQGMCLDTHDFVLPAYTTSYMSTQSNASTIVGSSGQSIADIYWLALCRDGTLQVRGQTNTIPPIPAGLTNIVAISAGPRHAMMILNDGLPVIARKPLNRVVTSGSQAQLSVGGAGAQPLRYQWQFNGVDLEGATDPVLTVDNIPLSSAGEYRCQVSNDLGTVLSEPAQLEVLRSAPRLGIATADGRVSNYKLRAEGLSGHGHVIVYVSTALNTWTPYFTNAPVAGSLELTDVNPDPSSPRFFKIVEQ